MTNKIKIGISVILISLYSCSFEDECNLDRIDIKTISQKLNNSFEIYYPSKEFDSLKYMNHSIKRIGMFQEGDSLFVEKAENKTDSIEVRITESGSIEINYVYYTVGSSPIYPIIIPYKKHLVIRCKSEREAEILCHNGKYWIENIEFMTMSKYVVKIPIEKNQIKDRELIIFEPHEDKSYVINLTNETVYK